LNAEQAMKTSPGAGHLRIQTKVDDAGVSVEVHDNGPGIPTAVARRIFEPLFSTKDVGQGTGLGLSIALGIVEGHGGTLALAEVATGACLRMTLPAATVTAPADVRPRSATPARAGMTGQRALVADDEGPVRMLLQRLLTRRGFAVDLASDGQMALQMLERHQYDVVICDVQMPSLGGLALYENLRKQQPEVLDRFVFISGDILNPQLHALSESSSTPVLSKPFSAAKLDSALDEVIGRRFGQRSVGPVQPP
jgi:CheY-like chemotaxis protein